MSELAIIAELAQGFEGKPAQAAALVTAAAAAGADAVKLQLVYADELATADYKHYPLFRRIEMPDSAWRDVAEQARGLGIALHLDIFGERSLALAESLGVGAVKVHSTDMGNPGLLAAVAASKVRQVLISTGGGSWEEIEQAVAALPGKDLVLLHGFQGYPTPVEANDIMRLRSLAERFASRPGLRLGFADHADPESPLSLVLAATALGAGATVLEKHLTLARSMKLEDAESALNPDEFAVFVRAMRDCAAALGMPGAPQMHPSERSYRDMTRKHVVATRAMAAGSLIAAADVGLKRTASPAFLQSTADAIGRRLKTAVRADEAISADMLEDVK